ncbi:nitrilase-related carbon-nitrogen hydrolase [Streptomyces sp. NBC_01190]|uniref:nitrilase-related carbon-nitrogen hydrolase n=1 Tax=Streptomyces sp. NBC_01190 TaxID=2903767 RepID=UPI00386B21BE|nr:hydrolase [Streptomyces sp. NBC_01190]
MTRIVCRQIAPRVGDLAANHERMLRTIAEATAAGADILVLPELASSGYVFASRTEVDTCAIPSRDPLIAAWSAAIQGPSVVVCGYAERGDDGAVYNSAVVLDSGGVLADYRKAHLWDREKLFFTPGTGRPPVVETRFGRIGVLICYDLEFPEYTRRIALDGADLIAVPTNWPHVRVPEGERPPEVVIAQAAARVNRVTIACCDRTGTERGQRWTEGTAIVDHNGWIVSAAGGSHVASAETDLIEGRDKAITPRNHLFADRRTDLY